MNEELKLRHLATITHESAVEMYEKTVRRLRTARGRHDRPRPDACADIARAEQIKQQLLDDIAKRGIGQERSNGRQKYWQENRSVAQVRAYAEQQRKHLSELRLTPNSRKAASVLMDDEFADF